MKCPKCHSDVSNDSIYCNFCGMNLLNPNSEDTQDELTKNIIPETAKTFFPGELFGERYKIIEELGRGGMGRVYKAEDRILGTTVALKVIRPEYITNKVMIQRFKKEILLAREITHENVVRIFDFGEIDNIKFISMEYIDGINLKDLINDPKPLDNDKIINIAIEICKGLSAAHKKGIIHRDLKPQNIMIDKNDHVYITDFGLAKSTTGESISQTGIIIGTPQYIAPEQWKGDEIGPETDIYTLGIILYEMITKHSLFDSESDLGYLQKHLNEKPSFNKEELEKTPLFLRKIVLKCLEKEKKFRYRSCGDIIDELKNRSYKKDPLFTSIRKLNFNLINLLPIIIAAVLIIISLFFRLNFYSNKPGISKKRSAAILYFNNLTGENGFNYLKYSLNDLLITDLAQSKFIRVLPGNKMFRIFGDEADSQKINTDPDLIRRLKDDGHVNYVIAGSFNRSGDMLRISTRLIDSETGELIDSNSVDTEPEKIFSAVDKITRRLKKSFNLSDNEIFEDIDPNIENITTSSPKALKFFIEGKRLFNKGNYLESLIPLKKAVKIDPKFAMGYRQIAWAYAYLNIMDEREIYFKETIKHIDRLSQKERLKILADYYGEDSDSLKKSIEMYEKLLKIYPEDIETNLQLAIIYRMLERPEEAIKKVMIVLKEDPSNINAVYELNVSLGLLGKYEQIEKNLSEFENNFPGISRDTILKLKFSLYLETGRYDLASILIDELNKLISDKSSIYSKWKIYLSQVDLIRAEREISELKKNSSITIRNLAKSDEIYMFLFSGKINEAVRLLKNEINKKNNYEEYRLQNIIQLFNLYQRNGMFEQLNDELNRYKNEFFSNSSFYSYKWKYYKSLLLIEKCDKERAESLIQEIEKFSSETPFKRLFKKFLYNLKGKFSEKIGNVKESAKYYLKTIDILLHPFSGDDSDHFNIYFYFDLAKQLFDSGQYLKAEPWFLRIVNSNSEKIYFGDIYSRSFYYLGKIYQKKGWIGKAMESFEKFYSLWKGCSIKNGKNLVSYANSQIKKLKNR